MRKILTILHLYQSTEQKSQKTAQLWKYNFQLVASERGGQYTHSKNNLKQQ